MNQQNAPWGDAELEADLAAERALPTAPAAEREALYAQVMGTVAAPVSESVAVPSTALGGPKLLVVVALLAGVAWFALRSEPAPVDPPVVPAAGEPAAREPAAREQVAAAPAPALPRRAPSPTPPATAVTAAPSAEPAAPTPAATATARPATPRPRPARRTSARASTLAAEQALLEGARRALAGGEPTVALRAIERHTRRFAAGQLVEERELLRIQSWVLAGERDRARAVAERFRVRFPDSLLLEALEAAVGQPEAR